MLLKALLVGFLCIGSIFSHALQAYDPNEEKIALLFLTISDLNHSDLWQTLLEECPERFNIYIHSKEPMKHPYFKDFRISKIVPTTWSIHVRPWQILVQEALKNPQNTKFVFLSESCVPLYPMGFISERLMEDNLTHMRYARPWWPHYFPREVKELDSKYRYGNHEWIVLNRRHAEVIANDVSVIRVISKYSSDQESYASTLFAIYGVLKEVVNHNYTYSNFEYATNNGANPYPFTEVSAFNDRLIEEAYSDGALFARKFFKTYPQEALLHMIRNHQQ